MEASESSVVELPTEPSMASVALEVPVMEASEAPVTPEAPFTTPEAPAVEAEPAPLAPPVTPGRIELSTGKVHDIQDISVCEDLSRQAGAGFQEFIRADGKPINISLEEIVSYE